MLKHLDEQTLNYLLDIFNACLKLEDIPGAWKHNLIYPISKKPIFTGQLNHTRPISLIEHTRKIFTKIITNRLSNICSSYPILNNSNFVALPGNSTTTPITILSHLIEDAQVQNKEIWMLAQDISKAYDSVHIPLLKRALLRIKVPLSLVNLITNIFTHRSNSVITNFGNTKLYQVHDGIDQGETITPLLWRIYYDPLLSKITQQ